ncbi:MAG: hypothetical protein LKM38_28450 [Pseudomonas veronii]|jgi:hypothetical protein|nr:hypothetical protein [Pseudomonas veronii]
MSPEKSMLARFSALGSIPAFSSDGRIQLASTPLTALVVVTSSSEQATSMSR